MTNFLVSTSLFTLLPRPYFYDVENVLLFQHSFKRPCEDSSTKRVLNLTQSTVTTRIENGLLAFFKAMLACHSVAYIFIYAKPNNSNKKSMESNETTFLLHSTK